MSANAIPREINLANTKPAATPAYTRRFANLSSNGNTFVDGQNIRINIDTSTPGAFIDPYSAYLEFDFTVSRTSSNTTMSTHCTRYVATHGAALDTCSSVTTPQGANSSLSATAQSFSQTFGPGNPNTVEYSANSSAKTYTGAKTWGPGTGAATDRYYADTIEYNYPQVGENDVLSDNSNYYRLPRCGAHAFIDEFRIYVQGVPIEEITSYNALAELLHDLNGVRDATDCTASARYRANGYPDTRTPFHPGILPIKQFKVNSWNCTSAAASTMTNYGNGTGKGFGIDVKDAVGPPTEIFGSGYITGSVNWCPDNNRLLAYAPGYGNFSYQSVNTGGVSSNFVTTVADTDTNAAPTGTSSANSTGTSSTTPSLMQQMSSYGTPAVYIDCMDCQELRQGVKYRVQIPLLSGVLGTMADKMFPSLLVASGTMYIDIKLATATQAVIAAVSNLMGCSVDDKTMFPNANYQFPTNIIGTTTGSGQRGPTAFAVPTTNNGAYPGFQDNPMGLSITNVSFVAKQIILQDSVTSAIVSRAAAGDISVHTTSYRSYSTDASNSSTAYAATGGSGAAIVPVTSTLLVPAKIASANALFVIFRDSAVLTAQRYNSLGRSAIGLNPTGSGASVQLRIGNELIPQTPITSSTEALIELMKAHHQYPDMKSTCLLGTIRRSPITYWIYNSYNSGSGLVVSSATTGTTGYPVGSVPPNQYVDPYDVNYNTDFQQWNDFNANMIQFPVTGSISAQYGGNNCVDCVGSANLQTGTQLTPATTTRSGLVRQNRAHTYMGGNLYEPAWYSTFALGFDLDTFAYDSGEIRSGRYMGNNVVTLTLNNAKIYNVDYSTTARNVRVDYFVQHDVRLSFQAGGVCQSFY